MANIVNKEDSVLSKENFTFFTQTRLDRWRQGETKRQKDKETQKYNDTLKTETYIQTQERVRDKHSPKRKGWIEEIERE